MFLTVNLTSSPLLASVAATGVSMTGSEAVSAILRDKGWEEKVEWDPRSLATQHETQRRIKSPP